MAIIDGKAPPSEQPNLPARIVVKLSERHSTRSSETPALRSRAIASLRQAAGIELRPYFSEDQALRAATASPFDLYLSAEIRDQTVADDIVKRLSRLPEVDEVYVEGGPCPPPSIQTTIRAAPIKAT